MKKLATLFIVGFLLFAISSCQKTKDDVNELTEFDIKYSTNLTIPSTSFTTVTAPVDITTPNIPTNTSTNLTSQKTTQDLVSEIKMTRFNISTTSANLDFLKSVSIYIKTASQGELLVASKTTIPAGTTSIAADLSDVNIKEYIFKDNIQFRVSFLFQTGSAGNQDLKLDQTVHVKATILK